MWRGEAPIEYDDPAEFYRRTYITEGLSSLIVGAVRRFSGSGGDPVIQLQTNFGGGKSLCGLAKGVCRLQSMTDIADSPASRKSTSRISAEDREIARRILKSGALDEALREVDEMELEAQLHEAQARQRKQE